MIGDGQAAIFAKRPGGNLDTGRGLSPLIFVEVHLVDYLFDHLSPEPLLEDHLQALIFLYVGLKDRVQEIVGRQRIRVFLVGPKFRRRRLLDYS
jgi:hypothetical protein